VYTGIFHHCVQKCNITENAFDLLTADVSASGNTEASGEEGEGTDKEVESGQQNHEPIQNWHVNI
jgi:hypothetical protein